MKIFGRKDVLEIFDDDFYFNFFFFFLVKYPNQRFCFFLKFVIPS